MEDDPGRWKIMEVYALWYGGASYAHSTDDDLEKFPSIGAAVTALDDRHRLGYSFRQSFNFVNREPESSYTPCVEDDSEIWLFLEDPTGDVDLYPDRIVRFGPRGGTIVERV